MNPTNRNQQELAVPTTQKGLEGFPASNVPSLPRFGNMFGNLVRSGISQSVTNGMQGAEEKTLLQVC